MAQLSPAVLLPSHSAPYRHCCRGPWCTAASYGGEPLVTAVTKLYMAPLKDDLPLVLNLSGPPKHPSFECHQYHHVCAHVHN
jgi:hypothetical protein